MTLDQILVEAYQNGDVVFGFWNAVAAIGGGLISGIFGSKKKKTESTSTSRVNFKQLASDAQAAGFNPLTALRSGAIGGYVTTKSTGSESGGGPSVGAAIGDAIAGAGQMGLFSTTPKYDPIKVRSMTSGRVSTTVAGQIFAGSSRAGSVVVAPRQTTVASPVTRTQPAMARSKGESGPDAWVRIYDPAIGRERWGVNPDGADLEQLLTPIIEGGADVLYRGFIKSRDQVRAAAARGFVTARPATPAQIKANKESWHGGWLPSFSFSWK